ncbi:MAG TPA: hypothetical protein VL524_03950 [Gemmatimonadaceae bacterium]|jgi:hypothetical protein|nr:hypothetical protein [Gemmatimonadaceae bacterium]
MNLRDALRRPAVRVSAALLLVASAVTARSIVDATRAAPVPMAPHTTIARVDQTARAPLPPPADIQSAVEGDLFSPDRSAPSAPYRMPGERDQTDAPAVEPMKPQVLGTVVATDGRSFATVQLGDDSPVLVHVGDKVGEWIVKAIGRGKLTVVTAGGVRADLSMSKPGT